MSAEHMSACPQCAALARARSAALADTARAAYGQVPAAEYTAMTAAAASAAPSGERTLAEYYEVHGAASGTVTVEYGASCSKCGLEASFKYEHSLLPANAGSGTGPADGAAATS
jgi:hypothetical protein